MEKHKILIVDDDSRLSHLVQTMLLKTGVYNTAVENRPYHAIATARLYKPDLILLDVDMPGKSGGDVAKEMKRDPTLAGIHVVFLTSLLSKEEAGIRELAGHSARFLSKPPEPQDLIDAIEEALASGVHSEATVR